jgi:hypothetical protein
MFTKNNKNNKYKGVAFMDRETAYNFSSTHEHFKEYCSKYNEIYIKLLDKNKGEYDYFKNFKSQLNLASNNMQSFSVEQLEELKMITQKQIENIDKELQTKKKDNDCIICYANKKEICFYPCGHFCACAVCSEKIKHCPVCRADIMTNVRLYDV